MDSSICIARLDFQRIYVLNINTHITLTTSKETTHLSAWIALVQAIVCSGAAGKKFSAGRVFFCLWYVPVVLTDWIFVVYLYCFVFADIVLNQRSWEYPHDIMIYNPILCWIDFCRNPWAGVYKFPQVPQSSPATSQSTCRFKLNGRVPSIPASERLGFLFATTPWPWVLMLSYHWSYFGDTSMQRDKHHHYNRPYKQTSPTIETEPKHVPKGFHLQVINIIQFWKIMVTPFPCKNVIQSMYVLHSSIYIFFRVCRPSYTSILIFHF